jgi:predicted acyltransferase
MTFMSTTPLTPATDRTKPLVTVSPGGVRLLSLDVFRGLTIAGMIIVNNPGGDQSYWPLEHAEWSGWTPTDLIFPFFLFIVGVAIAFAFESRISRGQTRRQILRHVFWRALILFAIGLLLSGYPAHYHLRRTILVSVIQRIAYCYVIASVVVLWCGTRGRIVAAVACIFGYWLLMRFVPVPGYGMPARDVPLLDPAGNLAAWLDHTLLGRFSSEGLLSTIPAAGTTMIGVLTGQWLRSNANASRKLAGMLVFGVIGVMAGEIFNVWFPINKKLWTSSYVLLTGGLALIGLSCWYWVLDVRRRRGWWSTALQVLGINAIVAYLLSELGGTGLERLPVPLSTGGTMRFQAYAYDRWLLPLFTPKDASLVYALVFLSLCWVVSWMLYRKHVVVKI